MFLTCQLIACVPKFLSLKIDIGSLKDSSIFVGSVR